MPAPCNLTNSKRLQAVVRVLLDGKEHSTMDLVSNSNQCAVDTAIRELRGPPKNLDISRQVRTEPDADGKLRLVHYYRLSSGLQDLMRAEAERLLEGANALSAGADRQERAA